MRLRWDRIGLLIGTIAVTVLATALATVWTAHAAGRSSPPTAKARVAKVAAPAALAQPGAGGCPGPAGATVRSAPAASGQARTVALTFDDGPSSWTPQVLAILQRERVPATFFMIGKEAAANPRAVAAVAAQGHLIGNHTWSHRAPTASAGWDAATLNGELQRTDTALKSILGTGTCWFRPPEGVTAGAAGVARSRGLGIALWSVDTEDWKLERGVSADADARLSRTIAVNALAGSAQDHPLILMHDGGGYRGATVAALPSIIAFYRASGYSFVRLDAR